MLLAFLSVAGVYFVHTYSYAPTRDGLGEREARILDLQDQARRGDGSGGTDRDALEQDLAAFVEVVERLGTLIPTPDEVPSLIEAIATEERRAGVEMTALRPEPPVPDEPYERWSYQLAVRGSYHAIGSFLTAIGSLDHIVVTDDMVIAAEGESPGYQGEEHSTVVASFRVHLRVAAPRRTDSPDPNEKK